MQIILLKKLENLGKIGDIIYVKPGYARNFLIPYGKAILATKDNIKLAEEKKKELKQDLLNKIIEAKFLCKKIKEIKLITIFAKSSLEGKLFGSVSALDISKKLSELSNMDINKRDIYFKNGVLRNIGRHIILFKPHSDVFVDVEVDILPQK
ncbi:MAG: 50S ribosomal protein L9 [Buchnera aphidicola (Chaetogeoica yunlongensis)]